MTERTAPGLSAEEATDLLLVLAETRIESKATTVAEAVEIVRSVRRSLAEVCLTAEAEAILVAEGGVT